jgi:dynein heavy chain
VFDGPVDAIWIENMNTVLDDNKKLCLMSGEIIKMNCKQNMLFEAKDLDQAQPATVSRCGMIYLDPSTLCPSTLTSSWLEHSFPKHLNASHARVLAGLFEWLLQPCLDLVSKSLKQFVGLSHMMLANSLLRLLTCLLDDVKSYFHEDEQDVELLGRELTSHEKQVQADKKEMVVAYFMWAVVWSVGGALQASPRKT